jgi:hypothetical protein
VPRLAARCLHLAGPTFLTTDEPGNEIGSAPRVAGRLSGRPVGRETPYAPDQFHLLAVQQLHSDSDDPYGGSMNELAARWTSALTRVRRVRPRPPGPFFRCKLHTAAPRAPVEGRSPLTDSRHRRTATPPRWTPAAAPNGPDTAAPEVRLAATPPPGPTAPPARVARV